MAHPLELSYNWRMPVIVTTVGLVLCVGLLFRSEAVGWLSVALVLIGVWALFVVVVYLRTRAYLMVEGSTLTVRRVRAFHRIEAAQVQAMKEFLTPNGPSYRLIVRDDGGGTVRYVAPVALLRGGHSTLFGWILTWAPEAELDKGSRRTLERLRIRGLVE